MTESKQQIKLVDILRPHEKLIMRLQEVLLLKRPIVFGLLLLVIIGITSTIKSWQSGIFASLTFICIVVYAIAIFWVYFGSKIEGKLFPPLTEEQQSRGAKLHSLDDLCEILSIHCSKSSEANPAPISKTKSLIIAVVCFALAFVFYFVNAFYLNITAVVILIAAPFVLSQPAVLKLFHHGKIPKYAESESPTQAQAPAPAPASEPAPSSEPAPASEPAPTSEPEAAPVLEQANE